MNPTTDARQTRPGWLEEGAEPDFARGTTVWSRTVHQSDDLFVDVCQVDDAEEGAGKPFVRVWIGGNEVEIVDEARFTPEHWAKIGRNLIDGANQALAVLEGAVRVDRWPFVEGVSRVWRYHRVAGGEELGVMTIAVQRDRKDWLAAMKPGEVLEHRYSIGRGFPKEHYVDTFLGEFELVRKLDDGGALVRPVEGRA